MQAGIIHPGWHQDQLEAYYGLFDQQRDGLCMHKHRWGPLCAAGGRPETYPRATAVQITDINHIDSGFIAFKVKPIFRVQRLGPSSLPTMVQCIIWHFKHAAQF